MRVGCDGEMRSGRTPKITVTVVMTVTPRAKQNFEP